jgi:hypothetical protein
MDAILPASVNAGCFMVRLILVALVIAASSGFALASPSLDTTTANEPARHRIEQRISDQPARILEQIRGSVCGTGPIYVGNADDPIMVTPLMHTTCTITAVPPDPR